MMPLRFSTILSLAIALLFPQLLFAGTLDDAPFRIIIPNTGWQLDDSKAQPMGSDVFLVATVSNTNTLLKSVVIKNVLANASDSSLDELCAGINDTLANPAVRKISEANTIFLGYKARRFSYEVTQAGQTTYNVTIVFVADGKGWTIACVGPPEQKDEIPKIIRFYQKKAD